MNLLVRAAVCVLHFHKHDVVTQDHNSCDHKFSDSPLQSDQAYTLYQTVYLLSGR